MLLGWMIAMVHVMPPTIALAEAEPPEPPPTTQPAGYLNIETEKGSLAARIRIDPRGVSSLCMTDEPDVDWVIPRKDHAWDYREWQWWQGHPWRDQMRPRLWGNPTLHLDDLSKGNVWLEYLADGFRGVQQFFFPPAPDTDAIYWDVVTTIENRSGTDVRAYGQFFACYTPVNRRQGSYFWEQGGRLALWPDRGVNHLDGYAAHPQAWFFKDGQIPHCPRGDGRVIGIWHHPVLVSHASPAGRRHVLMVEEKHCAGLTQGMEGNAMDYILYAGPDKRTFASGGSFSVHIRHVLIKSPDLPDRERLEELWDAFERSHSKMHRRAGKRRGSSPRNSTDAP